MPKIDVSAVKAWSGSTYPEPYASQVVKREYQALGDAGGLTQYGVDMVTMYPGDVSSMRHWHSAEDEFLWMVEGELVLVQDAGETVMRAGDAAAFPMGDPDGHHLLNRSDAEAKFLVVGTRAEDDVCTYSDIDMKFDKAVGRFTRRDGSALED